MQIRESLLSLAQPISQFRVHPKNVRQGDIGAIAESLKAHGQYRPIVVQRSTNQILAGNHTFQAAKSLGWNEIAATYVDCDDDQAVRILLADNRTNDLASYDDSALIDLLKELSASDTGLEKTLAEHIKEGIDNKNKAKALNDRVKKEAERDDIDPKHFLECKRWINAKVCNTYEQYLAIKDLVNGESD